MAEKPDMQVTDKATEQTIEQREVSLSLGILVERRKSTHPWGDWIWKPIGVFLDIAGKKGNWTVVHTSENYTHYHAGNLNLTLHRKETEALRANLMQDQPELYVALREAGASSDTEFPYEPFLVTASSYDAQDLLDAGDDIVEKVAMPEPVAAFIQAFAEHHHVEEVFKKRKRKNLDLEEHKFGKTPIFKNGKKPH